MAKKTVITPEELRRKAREFERQAEALESKMFESVGRLIAKNITHLNDTLKNQVESILRGNNVN